MKINIDTEILKNTNCRLEELFALLALHFGDNLTLIQNKLLIGGQISVAQAQYPQKYELTKGGKNMVEYYLNTKFRDSTIQNLEGLADKLRDLFPEGKKPGTQYYWRGSTALIASRLKQFFVKYGTEFTEEQLITATKNYIDSFNGNYSYMRILKYFIFCNKIDSNGERCSTSDLLDYIENSNQEDSNNQLWTSELR